MVRVRVHLGIIITPDQTLLELRQKVCLLHVYLVSSLIKRLAEPGFTRVPRTRWEAVARFSTLKNIFRVLVQFPPSKRSSLGAAAPRGARCWRRRCSLV